MTYVVYVAATVALLLLIVFVSMAVLSLRHSMLSNVRMKTVDLISVYDNLIEEKSRELAAITSGVTAVKDDSDAVGNDKASGSDASGLNTFSAGLSPLPKYRDSAVADLYGTIREHFSFSTEDVNSSLKNVPQSENDSLRRFEQLLDYETAFRLSSLPGEDQAAILEECFSGNESELLREYRAGEKSFSAIGFYDYLMEKAQMNDNRVIVRVPEHMASSNLSNVCDVALEYDKGICEGYIIEKNGRLYDYSVKAGELV